MYICTNGKFFLRFDKVDIYEEIYIIERLAVTKIVSSCVFKVEKGSQKLRQPIYYLCSEGDVFRKSCNCHNCHPKPWCGCAAVLAVVPVVSVVSLVPVSPPPRRVERRFPVFPGTWAAPVPEGSGRDVPPRAGSSPKPRGLPA